MTAALDHQADVVGAGEADGGGDIRRTLRRDDYALGDDRQASSQPELCVRAG
jgi:hypothetical protein